MPIIWRTWWRSEHRPTWKRKGKQKTYSIKFYHSKQLIPIKLKNLMLAEQMCNIFYFPNKIPILIKVSKSLPTPHFIKRYTFPGVPCHWWNRAASWLARFNQTVSLQPAKQADRQAWYRSLFQHFDNTAEFDLYLQIIFYFLEKLFITSKESGRRPWEGKQILLLPMPLLLLLTHLKKRKNSNCSLSFEPMLS